MFDACSLSCLHNLSQHKIYSQYEFTFCRNHFFMKFCFGCIQHKHIGNCTNLIDRIEKVHCLRHRQNTKAHHIALSDSVSRQCFRTLVDLLLHLPMCYLPAKIIQCCRIHSICITGSHVIIHRTFRKWSA